MTELCSGGELYDVIIARSQFTEVDAANVMSQLLSAIAYCHSHKVAHRDLKPENILFDTVKTDTIKLIDFGTA